tara:strand:- start:438 stop:848 length:411 start_codon:yes stop_codon:yes gene_type:complete
MSDDIVKTLLESLTEEQKAKLVAGLMKELVTDAPVETTEESVSSDPRRVNEDFTVNRNQDENTRKSPVKFRKNNWQDTGEDKNIDDYDKMSQSRTPRRRGKPKKRDVECHICGKSFAMNESLIYGEFVRCNRCTGR